MGRRGTYQSKSLPEQCKMKTDLPDRWTRRLVQRKGRGSCVLLRQGHRDGTVAGRPGRGGTAKRGTGAQPYPTWLAGDRVLTTSALSSPAFAVRPNKATERPIAGYLSICARGAPGRTLAMTPEADGDVVR